MSPTRYLGDAQPNRGKLTPAKIRALRLLQRHRGSPISLPAHHVRRDTIHALERFGLIAPEGRGHVLTEIGATAITRYAPRTRSGR